MQKQTLWVLTLDCGRQGKTNPASTSWETPISQRKRSPTPILRTTNEAEAFLWGKWVIDFLSDQLPTKNGQTQALGSAWLPCWAPLPKCPEISLVLTLLREGNGHRWLTGWLNCFPKLTHCTWASYSGGNCSTASTRVSETKTVEIWAMESGIPGLGTTDWLVQLLTLWCWGFLTRPHTSYL